MSESSPPPIAFADLGLPAPLLSALEGVGYETPSPIQVEAIPPLLQGRDLLGHAPTGTGKTAAFALPLLARLDMTRNEPQVLTLTPTRELAIQVAEAFRRYAAHVPGFHVLPVYGGQDYGGQIRQLRRGAHVIVGTPGRVMDHMRSGRLRLDGLGALVLDEADEMLRMGFIEAVEWILEQTPANRQFALFSATMPQEVERIARGHLSEPHRISIRAKTATAETVRQRYWMVSGFHKLDALTRILEVEPFEAVLVFVRTKIATTELAEKLEARGYAAAALNGDMPQAQREQTVARLTRGALDILVATDVAARGLDVERISHVVNYDIPYDVEAYIHRIGRTGRAGRKGEAILFVAPRERRMFGAIEKASRQRMELLELPSTEAVNNHRIAAFKQKISDTRAAGDLAFMQGLVEQYQREHDVPALEIAAALAKLTLGDQPLLLKTDADQPEGRGRDPGRAPAARAAARRGGSGDPRTGDRPPSPETDMERFRVEVGRAHGVQPGNLVGAVASEAGIDGKHIGRITIEEEFSTVDLPTGMPREVFRALKKVWVCGRQLRISRAGAPAPKAARSAGAGSQANPGPAPGQGPRAKPKPKPKPKPKAGARSGAGTARAGKRAHRSRRKPT